MDQGNEQYYDLIYLPFMSSIENIPVQFDAAFSEMESQLNGSAGSLVHDFQKKSFDTLKQIQFPDRKHEDWKYTSVRKLIEPDYTLAGVPVENKVESITGLESYIIEIINGKISLEKAATALRSAGIKITSLNDAFGLDSWKEVFLHWISQENPSSNRAFEFLNYAFH